MPSRISLLICYTMLAGTVLLAGCQSLGTLAGSAARPIAMHEFTLDPMDDVVGTVQVIKARNEDTLSDIARRFNVGYEEIVSANPGVDPWLPKAGTEVVIPTEFVLPDAKRQGIVINLAAMRLFYFPKTQPGEPQKVITHPIGIGRVGWRTPEGNTKIVSKTEAPAWIPTPAIRKEHAADGDPLPKVVPPGPDNPHGVRMRSGWAGQSTRFTAPTSRRALACAALMAACGCIRRISSAFTTQCRWARRSLSSINRFWLAGAATR